MADERGRRGELTPDSPATTASREAVEAARHGTVPRESSDAGAQAAGAAGGAIAGATAGTLAFAPIGTLIGGLAGALGGWWVGAAAADGATAPNEEDERAWRAHFESVPDRPADRAYHDYRAGYWLGHLARRNPEYAGRRFEEIEPELQRGWSEEMRRRYGDWASMRGYVRAAYARGAHARVEDPVMADDRRAALQDPLPPTGEHR
jgi:hypothetical protein